ncbi:acinetobactin biosynthesis protein [Snodgrassella alvi]|nr:acinetobactin biosynthesis protein [Snodgrassella alvi]ORF32421.1 acinetobactin biosynthesis protein [Snodgrassella alvi]ORF33779.1 acinetobactin biosynthesis protein [Snodgrassella alvi]ORF40908.1 acinetobactin biosynthesis protein [Snodgrassella alvi]ORF41481.1 acinetobactin biosynthesis protein [Snodgrassella alvi]
MQQLQEPEQVKYQLAVWQVNPYPDLTILHKSIVHLLEIHTDLNVRYQFTDDGDLYKYPDTDFSACIQTEQIQEKQLITLLAQLMQQSWQPETTPPFLVTVISTENKVFLALRLHPILAQQFTLDDLIQEIQATYTSNTGAPHQLELLPLDLTVLNIPATLAQPANTESLPDIILAEFRNTLAEPDMTADDDFFDFGGHSLLATRVIGNLQKNHGIKLNFNDFFKSPTAGALAKIARQQQPAVSSAEVQPDQSAPLTLAQDFLWQAYSAFDFSPIYNLPFAIEFQQPVNEEILHQAFNDLIIRHIGLRTLFKTDKQQTRQYTVPVAELNQYKWFWPVSDSHGVTLSGEAAYKFDLTRELPLRIRLLTADNGNTVLSFLVHHMVIDEWSLNTIMTDLSHAYAARQQGQAPVWANTVPAIHEFARRQQQNGINSQHLDYWRSRLQGAKKGLTLNTDTITLPENTVPQVKWLEIRFDSAFHQHISAFAKLHHASIFSVFYTAIATILQKEGNLDEIVIGTSASGRTDPNYFDTVGYFTTMVAHRTRFTPQQSFTALLADTSGQINESMDYADIPINYIQQALGIPDNEGLMFDVYIHIHSNNALNGQLSTAQGAIPYRQILPERNESMFGLHFEIMENQINNQYSLSMIITYQAHRYPTVLVERIATEVQQLLNDLAKQASA